VGPLPPAIVAFGARDRSRALLRKAFPRRRSTLTLTTSPAATLAALQGRFTDAVIVDLGAPGEGSAQVAALSKEFPSIPFFALAPLRASELPQIAQGCATGEFIDLLVEGMEDALHRDLIAPHAVTARFARAMAPAAAAIGLSTPLQHQVWGLIVGQGGRAVRTEELAAAVGLTREHLSRRFSAGGAPNLKRVIDLARLLAAAELAKNPGFDLPDVARVLGFASPTHLSTTCERLIGVRGASLARLRAEDLIRRFQGGGARSRGQVTGPR
jgi:AraC-like DNA-binding protein